jgi:hypothetical protein
MNLDFIDFVLSLSLSLSLPPSLPFFLVSVGNFVKGKSEWRKDMAELLILVHCKGILICGRYLESCLEVIYIIYIDITSLFPQRCNSNALDVYKR